ncbi:diaminopimelate epimerase [Oceanicella actignis]|uniref:Diaminopimelate epimerase n=2 Tax=Oceanicella actignis TaxID=1189325 RepID=A0A1M7S2E1_9RHOB|nr:diaminopimelate epimerase [Oceanicella actignis]SHN52661.1 diaminopimelate epimerase [Oceanicella actignis]
MMRPGLDLRPVPFRKMHGLGNDFVVIDARAGAPRVTPALARALGDRHFGVGFDQLAEILDPDRPDEAARVVFWNPDGGVAGACGNATRCVARLLMEESGADALILRSERGPLACRRRPDGLIEVDMGAPVLDWTAIPLARPADIDALPIEGAPSAVGMGNPHCVFFVDDAEAVALERLGPAVERHPLFPERTNVEFVQVLSPGRIRMRVWERGAGVTLACGSGACAAAVAAARRGLTGRRVEVLLDGGALQIDWRDEGVVMAGPAALVFEGRLSPEFLAGALGAGAPAGAIGAEAPSGALGAGAPSGAGGAA